MVCQNARGIFVAPAPLVATQSIKPFNFCLRTEATFLMLNQPAREAAARSMK